MAENETEDGSKQPGEWSRRKFLKRAGLFVAGTAVAGGVAGNVSGRNEDAAEVQTRINNRSAGLDIELITPIAKQIDSERTNPDVPMLDMLMEYKKRLAARDGVQTMDPQIAAINEVEEWRDKKSGGRPADKPFADLLADYKQRFQKQKGEALTTAKDEIEQHVDETSSVGTKTGAGVVLGSVAGTAAASLGYAAKLRAEIKAQRKAAKLAKESGTPESPSR